jgi:3-dehydroquinate dehydratase II
MECDILLLNGPNLNMLGVREPETYGYHTLEAIELQCAARATSHHLTLEAFQSNHEGELVDKLNEGFGSLKGLIINPSGYTHTSIALRDAVSMLKIPTIEVHLSNIHAREAFRQVSFISGVATAVICGLGAVGYIHAVDAIANLLKSRTPQP